MQIHLAIYRFKADTDPQWIAAALESIEALTDKIPGIVEITTGVNSSPYGAGYTHTVLVRGLDQAAIDAYRQHPDHQAATRLLDQIEEHSIGIDFATS